MQNHNDFKISQKADTEIKDMPTLNILICHLLHKLQKPINTEHMYDILVATGLVNYFYYQDSIAFLLENGHIRIDKDEIGNEYYVLLPKGTACAKTLKGYAPKSSRDNLVMAATKYFTRKRNEKEVDIQYSETDNGCYISARFHDVKNDLMVLKLFAPDMTQARYIGEKIMCDPAAFYSGIIGLIIKNEEVNYDLSDN